AAELRRNDTERAQKQREEDKEIARLQREEDKKREEDREIARQQRADDKENARLQREVDLKIARDKRIQEYELTEKEHSLYQSQRAHEIVFAQENYIREFMLEEIHYSGNILLTYQRELSALLGEFQIKPDDLDRTLLFTVQMRTRTTLQLLDTTRRTILVRTLFQANLLNDKWKKHMAILYNANVSGVQFDQVIDRPSYKFPDIERADLRYTSFRSMSFGARLDHSIFIQSDFAFVSMADGNMSNGSFIDSVFETTNFDRVDFSGADFRRCTFRNISMVNCSMFGVKLQETKLFYVNLFGCMGFQIEQIYSLSAANKVTLPNGTLLHSQEETDDHIF
ncbi:unnamed protein product, partial [Adineta steineri]